MTIKLQERNTGSEEYVERYTRKEISHAESFSPSMVYIHPFDLRIAGFAGSVATLPSPEEVSSTSNENFVVLIEGAITKEEELRRLVGLYLGYGISSEEFEYRFGDVDLEYFHEHMDPDVFRAFIKGLGAIPGSSGLFPRREEEIL